VNATIVKRKELITALNWPVLKVPKHEFQAKFATKFSKASIHVLVKGKQAPNGFSNCFIDRWDDKSLI